MVLICLLLYTTGGMLRIKGEADENKGKADITEPVHAVMFTVEDMSNQPNELRKAINKDFFSEFHKYMQKYGVKNEDLILRSPSFAGGHCYLIIRVDERGSNDPLIEKMNGAIWDYLTEHAIRLKSIEHLIH